ncbi:MULTISPECIES: hypothetical protein [Phenylobacterium]|uniref:Uncharacterized protein n=1 Tax=Phenylobacterium koreense TaxID=266125 RepID=A0ABV2ENF4_9CAUL
MTFFSATAASPARPALRRSRRPVGIPFNWRLAVALTANALAWLAIIGAVVALAK